MKFTGTLVYDDNGDYIIDGYNLSEILYAVFTSMKNGHIDIQIRDNFNEKGILYRKPSEFNIKDYYVNKKNLTQALFESTNNPLEIIMEADIDYEKYRTS